MFRFLAIDPFYITAISSRSCLTGDRFLLCKKSPSSTDSLYVCTRMTTWHCPYDVFLKRYEKVFILFYFLRQVLFLIYGVLICVWYYWKVEDIISAWCVTHLCSIYETISEFISYEGKNRIEEVTLFWWYWFRLDMLNQFFRKKKRFECNTVPTWQCLQGYKLWRTGQCAHKANKNAILVFAI